MRRKRQTHLGSTDTKSLVIMDNLRTPLGEAFIFRLPDELLVLIVELAQAEYDYDKCVLQVLCRLCRRLRRIAQPILFRVINIKSPNRMVPPSGLVKRLYRTLKENADLRRHCRSIDMHIPDISSSKSPHDYRVAQDFAHWLTRTQRLSIHGGFEGGGSAHTWALIRQLVAKWKDVEYVQLSREGWGLYLIDIFNWLHFPKMKKLSLHGISEWKHGAVELESEKRRTASFTSLHISDYEERPEATFLLLQWPTVLTHFSFGSFYNNPHIMDYPMLTSWLLIHKDTLKHISIGYLSRRHNNNRPFDATLFPNLEFLQLSRWQKGHPVQFQAEDANVLGPRLHTFTWSFTIYDQHTEGWDNFGLHEVDWVRRLVEVAIARKAALKTIKIQFAPDYYWDTTEEMGYPWDRMDSLRDQVLRPNGMELLYNEPTISKERWLEHVRSQSAESGEILGAASDGTTTEQSGAVDEEDESNETELEYWTEGYHGEDIRGYLVG